MQESCFLWEEFLRRQKIIIDGHMSQLEKRAVIGRTLAITKDRNTIQISLSKKMGMSFSYHERSKGSGSLCAQIYQGFQ